MLVKEKHSLWDFKTPDINDFPYVQLPKGESFWSVDIQDATYTYRGFNCHTRV